MNLSAFKSAALWAADRLHWDPYEKFTRPIFPSREYRELGGETGGLAAMAETAHRDLENFKILGGRIIQNRLPRDGRIDTGDQAIWHGIYTAMHAFRYAVTKDPFHLADLALCVEGLKLHQPNISRITHPDADGFGGILCRGVDPTRNKNGEPIKDGEEVFVQWDASNDSACGHLAGLWWAWKYGDVSVKKTTARLLLRWAENIYTHNGALINPDGKPTSFGALDQGALTDPLRATLLMAIYGAAHRVTWHPLFAEAGLSVAKKYGALIPHAKTRLWWIDKHTDTHRAAIQLAIMMECGMYFEWHPKIIQGMRKIFAIGQSQANAWVCVLTSSVIRGVPDTVHFGAWLKRVLSEFSVTEKRWNSEKNNVAITGDCTNQFVNKDAVWNSRIRKWEKQRVALQPLPLWARGSQDFFWQRHPYSVVDWKGNVQGDTRHNSADYLAVFWKSVLDGALE